MPKLSMSARARACALLLAIWVLVLAQAAAAAEAVIAYPPAFFAAQRPDNAREMLERLPGFTLDFGSGVRGFEGAAGNVLIDGQRPASKTDGLYDILTRIPAGTVERIDVISGGAPGVDMQGKAVVANVITKKDAAFRAQVSVQSTHVQDGRTLAGLDAQASGGSGGRRWEVAGTRARGYDGLSGPGAGVTVFPDARGTVLTTIVPEGDGHFQQGTGAYELPLAGGTLRVNGRVFIDKYKFEEDARDLATLAVRSTDQTILTDERELGGRFSRPLSARTGLELVALRQTNDGDLTSTLTTSSGDQRFDLDRKTRETIGRAVLKHSWRPALSLEAGAEAADNRLDSVSAFRVNGADVLLPGAQVVVKEARAEAFGKASWRISPQWSLDGSLRYERSRVTSSGDVQLAKTLQYVKPRLVATWSPDAANQLRLRIEREVGQLDFDDFVAQASLNTATGVTAGNPDLEPQRAWVAEAAFERRFWGRGSVIFTVQRFEVSGVVDRGPVFSRGGVFDRPANIGDGTKDILRVDLTLPLERTGLKGAQLKGFVARRWSRVDDPTTGESRRISNLRHIEWETHFTQDLPSYDMSFGASAYGGWQVAYYRFNAIDAVKLDPFVMVFAEWRPRPDLSFRAEVGNLTDRGYRRVTLTYPGPRNSGLAPTLNERETYFGRNYFIRVRKSFGG